MPKPASDFVDDLRGHLKNIEKTRSKTERLYQEGSLVKRDLELVYAGLYLDAMTSFENFIEDLFIGFLVGTIVHSSRSVVPKITFKSTVTCRNVVYGNRRYVDWFPYERTQERARQFFKSGRPFTKLDSSETKEINRMFHIRNAIAHKSKHALRIFRKRIIDDQNLLSQEKNPVGYLKGYYTVSPPETRYELIIRYIVQIARKLCI